MKLEVKTAVLGAVLASTAVLAVPGTASADYNACQDRKICLFDGHNGTGEVLQLDPATYPDLHTMWWGDRASSLWNRSNQVVCVWTDVNNYGFHYKIDPGEKQELAYLYDNAVSSLLVNGCGG
ncbi:hypothetical protein STENM327S_04024 [Streptomyces tendae]